MPNLKIIGSFLIDFIFLYASPFKWNIIELIINFEAIRTIYNRNVILLGFLITFVSFYKVSRIFISSIEIELNCI